MRRRRASRKPHPAILIFLCLAILALIGFCAVCIQLVRGSLTAATQPEPVIQQESDDTQTDADSDSSEDRWGQMQENIAVNNYSETAFSSENGIISYSSESVQALQGIDVSAHNGEIDWAAVREDGIDFAILQVGYRGYVTGALAADAAFYTNADGATSSGISIGAYFFSQALSVEEAEEEAQYVVELLSGMHLDWPVFFDWEPVEDDARTNEVDTELLTSFANAFCSILEEAGFQAGIYFNQELGYLHYNLSELEDYDFWLAEYSEIPTFYYHFEHWQYSSSGTVSGISTSVDRVLSFRDYRP